MQSSQQIEYFESPNGAITAKLTVRLPDGTEKVFSAAVDGDDFEQLDRAIASSESGRVGVTAPGAREWWWQAVSARALGFNPNDTSPRAMAAQEQWWLKSKNADRREDDRAAYLAITENPEFVRNPPAGNAWWGTLSPERRTQIRHRYRPGLHDATRIVKKYAKDAVSFIPVVGPAANVAITAAQTAIDIASTASATGKKLAGSKVLDLAARQLASSPAPAARAAAGQFSAASKLAGADIAANLGAKKTAQTMIRAAQSSSAPAALAAAKTMQSKLNALAHADDNSLAELARNGRVRAADGKPASLADVAAAKRSGRLFLIAV